MSETKCFGYTEIYGLEMKVFHGDEGLRLEFKFDKDEAKGTIVLKPSAYGLDVYCPEVHEEPLALLDLFYASPSAIDAEYEAVPFQIVFDSPKQSGDPLGRVRFFPEGTRVDFEQGVQEIVSGPALHLKEFGYPPEMTVIDTE